MRRAANYVPRMPSVAIAPIVVCCILIRVHWPWRALSGEFLAENAVNSDSAVVSSAAIEIQVPRVTLRTLKSFEEMVSDEKFLVSQGRLSLGVGYTEVQYGVFYCSFFGHIMRMQIQD